MLSQAQAGLFISRAKQLDPRSNFEIIVRDTAGDLNQQQALQDIDGKDFFTKDIQDFLLSGQADFAVHSLKDVSSELFFKDNHYAIFSREDPRDVAIFNEDVRSRIAAGATINIGTSSPRRALMATRFLLQALPTVDGRQAVVKAMPIRGNVDTRLRKLTLKQYDGVILAVAGLNRLLRYGPSNEMVTELLKRKMIMVLPLIECPPAPGQGALVAETRPGHDEAIAILTAINDKALGDSTRDERELASRYGAGCHQQFGVVHIDAAHTSFTYGSGVSNTGDTFSVYRPYPEIAIAGKRIFSSGDHMRSFFRYTDTDQAELPKSPAFFIGSRHALHSKTLIRSASQRRIWTAGTKTWIELAREGLWIEGCADALGLGFIESWLSDPLIGISRSDMTIITDAKSAAGWKNDGWPAHATYRVTVDESPALIEEISSADIIFWTSFRQFEAYRNRLKATVIHCCSEGKTARLFHEAGKSPVVFPGIKGFNEWRKQISHTAAKGE